MTVTSKEIDRHVSGSVLENSSRLIIPHASGRVSRLTSRLSETCGGIYVSPVPILLSGPTVSDITTTTARISWELDPSGPEGYHRVRHKVTGGEWAVIDFTEESGYSAQIDLGGLPPEHTKIIFDIQSCAEGDGSKAFDYYPGDDSAFFYTLCDPNVVYSNVGIYVGFLGEAHFTWDTNTPTKGRHMWKSHYPPLPWNDPSDWTSGYSISHNQAAYPVLILKQANIYKVKFQGKNRCGYEADWSSEYVFFYTGTGWMIIIA